DFSSDAVRAEGRTAMPLPYAEWLAVQDYADLAKAWVGHLGFERIDEDEVDPDTQPDKLICTTDPTSEPGDESVGPVTGPPDSLGHVDDGGNTEQELQSPESTGVQEMWR